MIPENLLNQAARWGFICELDEVGRTFIYSDNPPARWSLQLVGDRWILRINEVPQINFQPLEALQFLERQWLRTNAKSRRLEPPSSGDKLPDQSGDQSGDLSDQLSQSE